METVSYCVGRKYLSCRWESAKELSCAYEIFCSPGYFHISGQVALILSHRKWHLICHNQCCFSGLIDRQIFPKAHFGLFTLLLARFADLNTPFGSQTRYFLLYSKMMRLKCDMPGRELHSSKWKESYQMVDTNPNERPC